jgi:hypothetical protein
MKNRKKFIFFTGILFLLLVGCAPSESSIPTAVAQTEISWTATVKTIPTMTKALLSTLNNTIVPINIGFGPETVWDLDGHLEEFHNCNYQNSIDCVITLMKNSGASPQAIAFTKLMQGEAFMSSFTEFGIVDLAEITYPTRANSNIEYILINGNPQIVFVEDVYKVDITHDPNYPPLHNQYPNLRIEGGVNIFKNMEQNSTGVERFIFECKLVDGCHACQIDKYAYISFDFDSTGQFEGMKLLYIK